MLRVLANDRVEATRYDMEGGGGGGGKGAIKSTIKVSSMHRTVDRVKARVSVPPRARPAAPFASLSAVIRRIGGRETEATMRYGGVLFGDEWCTWSVQSISQQLGWMLGCCRHWRAVLPYIVPLLWCARALQIRQMDPKLYCVLLLAKMKNGKLQVASNYPEVGSQFITSELALRFANCTNEGKVFQEADVRFVPSPCSTCNRYTQSQSFFLAHR